MATINLVDLKKNYGNVPAVKGVNLSVADGELIVLVGPSGCGKSTLLRMVAGLETVSEGRIEIGGRDVVKAEPAERDIAMVFQNYALYPHMSVRGNLEYGLKNRGTPRAEIEGVRGVAASELPALEYLDIWLGVQEYGGDATLADLAPILAGGRFPALRHLGLRNSEIQDEIAAAVAAAPVVAQLKSLDLSMGVLTDDGVAALLAGQPLTHLTWLDLHHNFVTEQVAERVRAALEPSGVEVDLSERGEEWEDDGVVQRFTAVAE